MWGVGGCIQCLVLLSALRWQLLSFSLLQTLAKRPGGPVGGEGGATYDVKYYTWWRHNLYIGVTLKVRYWYTDQHKLLHTHWVQRLNKLQYTMQIQTWLLAGHTRHGSILPLVKGSSGPECNHSDTSCEHVNITKTLEMKRAVEMSKACLLGLQIESWYVVTWFIEEDKTTR